MRNNVKHKLAPHRLDLAPRVTGLGRKKCNRGQAVGLAKNKALRSRAVANIVASYYSNYSIAAKNSKRKMVDKLLKAANLSFPLTPLHIKTVAGALKEAGYKSTFSYLIEMKTMHIELDYQWTSLLDRHFKLCMAAAKRNMAPERKLRRSLKTPGPIDHSWRTPATSTRRFAWQHICSPAEFTG